MDRQAYIRGLRLDRLIGGRGAEDFFRSLPRRTPTGSDETATQVRASIERHLSELHAAILGRAADLRVPVDVEAISTGIAGRIDRFTGADWDKTHDGRAMVEHVKHAIGEISADLHTVEAAGDGGDGDDDELE